MVRCKSSPSVGETCAKKKIISTPTCLNNVASVSIKLKNDQINILLNLFICYSRITPIESHSTYLTNESGREQKPVLKGITTLISNHFQSERIPRLASNYG